MEPDGPTPDLLLLVLSILDAGHKQRRLIREYQAPGLQVSISGVQHRVQHALIQEEIPHPLGHYDIDLRERQLDLLHLALQQRDPVGHPVRRHDLPRLVDDGRHVDADHEARARPDAEHAEDGGAAADVEHDLVFEEVPVLVDRVAVGARADFVFLGLGGLLT